MDIYDKWAVVAAAAMFVAVCCVYGFAGYILWHFVSKFW